MFHICLYCLIRVFSTNQPFRIKHGILGIDGGLVFGGIADETFSGFGEGNIRRSDTIALIVGNDVDFPILEDTHAGVSGTKIDADNGRVFICTVRRGSGKNRRHKEEANERQEKKTDNESSSKSPPFLVSFGVEALTIVVTIGHGC